MSDKQQQRREARGLAIQTLFAFLERDQKISLADTFATAAEGSNLTVTGFAWEIVNTAVENLGKIKVIIRAFAPEFVFEKIAPINRSLLILGIAEMKFMDTPPVVVINEYIELAKDYGEDKSPNLINGVLDNYRKSLGLERSKDTE